MTDLQFRNSESRQDSNRESYQFNQFNQFGQFGRVRNYLLTLLLGIIIFLAAFPVLIINEKIYKDKLELVRHGKDAIVEIQSNEINGENDNKPVHFIGDSSMTSVLEDELFGISSKTLALRRVVDVYTRGENGELNWQHTQKTDESFAETPIETKTIYSPDIKVGDFYLSTSLKESMETFGPLVPDTEDLPDEVYYHDTYVYLTDPNDLVEGDIRIYFQELGPQKMTIVGEQKGDVIYPYKRSDGTDIAIARTGLYNVDELLPSPNYRSQWTIWSIRLLGILMFFASVNLVLLPLRKIAPLFPAIGTLVRFGITFFSTFLAMGLSLIVIGFSWVFFKPSLGILLLVFGFLLLPKGIKKVKYKRPLN